MSRKYRLSQTLGVWLIFASVLPLLFTIPILSALVFGFPLDLTYFSYGNIFLLCSPPIMIILGYGLIKKYSWARNGLIIYLLLSIIFVAFQYPLFGINPAGVSVTIIIIGILLFSTNRISSKEESDKSTVQPSTMGPI